MSGPGRHILVVDDMPDNRNLLVQQLRRKGHRVSEAADGAAALALIGADRPDLVLLDLMMPVMDGFGVLERLKGDGGPLLPVIVLTAATEREARMRALTLGAHEFLNKPFDTEELFLRIGTLLRLKDAQEELRQQAAELEAQAAELESQATELADQAAELELLNESLQAHNTRVEAIVAQRTQEIERQRAFSERLIHHVPAGILYLDRDLVVRIVNPALLAMLGMAPGDVVDRPIFEVFPAERDRLGPLFARELETGAPYYASASPLQADGRHLKRMTYWDVSHFPLRGADGAIEGILLMALEVTERVERERAQRDRVVYLEELDRYKDEFLSVISHELRTPLNFIMGFASILEDDPAIDETRRSYVTKILSGADRMLMLVNDLLDVARLNAGKVLLEKEPVRYGELVDHVLGTLKPLADEKRLTLTAALEVPERVMVDSLRIIQVLTNLVGNAIKFTPAGGAITVKAFQRGGELITEVKDTGCGIDPEHAAVVFERFIQVDMSATRQAGGAGLGLAISKGLVEAHGGSIGVSSQPGAGSTFWYALPLEPVPTPTDALPAG
jgi:PAS domain S-box-containing protein